MLDRAAVGEGPTDAYAPFVRAFDAAAPTYDADYGPANLIMSIFRARSLAVLDAVLPSQGLLLELGCGTGVEAVALARGAPARRIVATDLSARMLAQAQQRAAAEGVAAQLAFRCMAAGEAGALREAFGPAAFAGAYSSFGALNCEPDLRRVAAGLAPLLSGGAPFVVSVINRYCLWEIAWHLAHGDVARARRRLERLPLPLFVRRAEGGQRSPRRLAFGERLAVARGRGVGEVLAALPIAYLTPRALAAAFAPWFRVEQQEGMGVALPPPALSPWLARRPRLGALLLALEARLRSAPVAAWLGDHVLMVLRRTAAGADEGAA